MDFIKIAKAWIASYNPNEKQLNMAKDRYTICDVCPSKVESTMFNYKCNECGCPISKKIFSSTFNDCPLSKWESIDLKYFPPRKTDKSIC